MAASPTTDPPATRMTAAVPADAATVTMAHASRAAAAVAIPLRSLGAAITVKRSMAHLSDGRSIQQQHATARLTRRSRRTDFQRNPDRAERGRRPGKACR